MSTRSPERITGWNKLTAVTVLTSLALAGCAPNNSGAEAPEKAPTSTSETAEPTIVIPEIDPSNPEPIRFTEEQLAALEAIPMPEELKKYDEMSFEEFSALPIEERLTFISYLNRDRHYQLSNYALGSGDNRKLLAVGVTEQSPAQSVLVSGRENLSAAYFSHFGGRVYENIDNQKILTGSFYDVAASDEFSGWSESVESAAGRTSYEAGTDGDLSVTDLVSEESAEKVVLPDGSERLVRTIVGTSDGGTSTFRFVFVEYTAYDGSQESTYVTLDKSN